MAGRRSILVFVACLSTAALGTQTPQRSNIAYPTAQANSPIGEEVADDVDVLWSRVTYRKGLVNPTLPPERRNSMGPESLQVSCVIRMADPRLLLGIAPEPTIEQITDARGNDVEILQGPARSRHAYFQDMFLKQWLSEMNLEQRVKPWARHTDRIGPTIQLGSGYRDKIGGQIGLLRGYCIGLVAESLYNVDLPFRTSDEWVRLTDDLDIRVIQAENAPGKHYWKVELRPEDAPTGDHLWVGDYLPSRLLVSPVIITRNSSGVSASGGGRSNGVIRGSGLGRAEGIRFVMAVNPAHAGIPFELRDVPLAAPIQATPPRPRDPNRWKRPLGGKFVAAGARTAMRYEADKARSLTRPAPLAEEGRLFDVNWRSVGYTLNLHNPAVSGPEDSLELSVICDAKILDPERILGTCNEPIIEKITDGSGRDIDISLNLPRPDRMLYETPRYRASPVLTPPSPLAQLQRRARQALHLPLDYRHLPKRKMELEPVTMIIRLDPRLIGPEQKEIALIEGYFHALTAESYKHVKVPFKPSGRWVRLTSDLDIQVGKAWNDGVNYRYTINERSKAQIEYGRLHVYCPLADGILVERQFTGPDTPPKRDDTPIAPRSLPALAGGEGSVGQTVDGVACKVDAIDYRIAVNPTHYRIPIKLEHIPLP